MSVKAVKQSMKKIENWLNISLALDEGGKMKEVRYSLSGAVLSMVLVIFPNVKVFWRFLNVKVICWEIFSLFKDEEAAWKIDEVVLYMNW